MLQFQDISHQFGPNVLFKNFNWHIKPSSRIGLIGPNGSGKTTLFKIAIGKIKPDGGKLSLSKNTKISSFQQIPDFDKSRTILETALQENVKFGEYTVKFNSMKNRMEEVSHDDPVFEQLLHEQAELEDWALQEGIHELELRAKKILSGLGFSREQWENPISSFSPGFQHRLALAVVLLNEHNLLFLDEPTNHLDDASKKWLSDYLNSTESAFILVSHDPEFLDSCVTKIAEISVGGVTEFSGKLQEYLEEKNEIHEKLMERYKKEEAYVKKRMDWIDRFRAKATKAKQAQSALKKLEKRDKAVDPGQIISDGERSFNFRCENGGKIAFRFENASFSYPGKKPVFSRADLEISRGEKAALVGPNGTGKSTLLKCAAEILQINEGEFYKGPRTQVGYFSQTHEDVLYLEETLIGNIYKKFPEISEESARSLLGYFSFSDDLVYKKAGTLSGGEQSRLRLAILVLSPTNLLLLDEPTNHLDLATREGLKQALIRYPGSAVIISHDPDFLSGLCNKTYEMSDGVLYNRNCSYDEFIRFGGEALVKKSDSANDAQSERVNRKQDKNRVKKLLKDIKDLEENIATMEKKMVLMETEMASPDFFKNTKDPRAFSAEYDQLKTTIADQTELWIQLQEGVDKKNSA